MSFTSPIVRIVRKSLEAYSFFPFQYAGGLNAMQWEALKPMLTLCRVILPFSRASSCCPHRSTRFADIPRFRFASFPKTLTFHLTAPFPYLFQSVAPPFPLINFFSLVWSFPNPHEPDFFFAIFPPPVINPLLWTTESQYPFFFLSAQPTKF